MMEGELGRMLKAAAKLKGAEMEKKRPLYETWPAWKQHSMFERKDVTEARALPHDERLEAMNDMICRGNELFADKKYQDAEMKYENAMSIVSFVTNKDSGWKKKGILDKDVFFTEYRDAQRQPEIDAVKIRALSNLAATYLKQKKWDDIIPVTNQVLELDPNNTKALFRRAMARLKPPSSGATECELGAKDLRRAASLDPECSKIKKQLRIYTKQVQKQRQSDRKNFRGFLHRKRVYDEDDHQTEPADAKPAAGGEITGSTVLQHMESLARQYEERGNYVKADQYRAEIKRVLKKAEAHDKEELRKESLRQVDFMNPTPQMIEEAKRDDLDLTDPEIQKLFSQLQARELEGNAPAPTPVTPRRNVFWPVFLIFFVFMLARMYYIGAFDFVLNGGSKDTGVSVGEDSGEWTDSRVIREQLMDEL